MELIQHPLSALFPAMSSEDFNELKNDIAANGQHAPVMVLDGMVLDGWHRYRACMELDLTPTQIDFPDNEDPVAFVKSVNLHRRHLTDTQRAAATIACSAWAPPHRLKNKQAPVPASAKTNAEMAAEARVSKSTIKNAKAAHKAGWGAAMKDGTITAKEGARLARGKPAPAKKAEAKTAPSATPAASPGAYPAADEAFEGFDAVHELASTQKLLEAAEERIASLTKDDLAAELNKQMLLRQQFEALLGLEINKARDLQNELESYGRWYAELRKVSSLEERGEITKLVREAANNRSEAV